MSKPNQNPDQNPNQKQEFPLPPLLCRDCGGAIVADWHPLPVISCPYRLANGACRYD